MAWTPSTFRARFTEFSTVDDSVVQGALDEAAPEVSSTKWGAFYEFGVGYLAAHLLKIQLTIEGGDSALNSLLPLVTKTVGDVSASFATYKVYGADNSILSQTSYGREYIRKRRLISFGGLAMGEDS
jgi:hypothetical protein